MTCYDNDGGDCDDGQCLGQTACYPDGSPCATGEFCNFDHGSSGFCEPCSSFSEPTACYDDGLPSDSAADCHACCFQGSYSYSYSPTTYAPTAVETYLPTNYEHSYSYSYSSGPTPTCGAGRVADCSGDGDCCPESWIGDDLCDGEDQEWGCDLSCFDNDGGDCDGGDNWDDESPDYSYSYSYSHKHGGVDSYSYSYSYSSGPTPTCGVGYVADCSGDGDCCLQSWIGDGWCDGEDQRWHCDLTCYDNDGGDCDGDDNWDDESPDYSYSYSYSHKHVGVDSYSYSYSYLYLCAVGYVADGTQVQVRVRVRVRVYADMLVAV